MSYSVVLNSAGPVEVRTASGLGAGALLITRPDGPGKIEASASSTFASGVVDIPSSPDVAWGAATALYMRGYGKVIVGVSSQDVYDPPFVSRALTKDDNGKTLLCLTAQVATVNKDLPKDFGCAFSGPVSFTGTATVGEKRTAGDADPVCALLYVGVDSYKAVGKMV